MSGQNAKNSQFGEFWKTETCCQTVLPDRSVQIGQKLVEKVKIETLKCDNLVDFQTLCMIVKALENLNFRAKIEI